MLCKLATLVPCEDDIQCSCHKPRYMATHQRGQQRDKRPVYKRCLLCYPRCHTCFMSAIPCHRNAGASASGGQLAAGVQEDADDAQVSLSVEVRHHGNRAVLQLADSRKLQAREHAQLVQLAVGQKVQPAAQHAVLRVQLQ